MSYMALFACFREILGTKVQYQGRVRARLGPCLCGNGHVDVDGEAFGYLSCAAEDNAAGCSWTPWSPPSAPATPGVDDTPSGAV